MNLDLYTCIDTERAILGVMTKSPKAAGHALSKIHADDFYRDSHRLLFETLQKMFKENTPIDLITVLEELKKDGNLAKIGAAEVARLTDYGLESHLDSYIQTLREKSERRHLRSALQKNLAALDEPDNESDKVFAEAQREIYQVFERKQEKKYHFLKDLLPEYMERLEKRAKEKQGLSWGFKDMDTTLGLIMPGRVYYVGARPGTGKTAFALTVAQNVAKAGVPVYFASMEMNWEQLLDRGIASISHIDGHVLQHGYLQDSDRNKVNNACNELHRMPFVIDDEQQTTFSLLMKARQFRREMLERARQHRENGKDKLADNIEKVNGIGLLVIDYFQYFNDQGEKDHFWTQLASKALVDMAKDLGVPILCLTQLNRENEKRGNNRPKLSDLRGGGSQEQDGWAVMLLHHDKEDLDKKDIIEVIAAKNRSGPTGTVELRFMREYTKMTEVWWKK